jgi:hypothetical protein
MTMTLPESLPEPMVSALVTGRVRLHGDASFTVSLESGGDCRARRAASCLLAPRTGDRVLLALTPEPFVLAVLEREESRPAELTVDGDATLRACGGRLDIEGERGLGLRARTAVEIVSARTKVQSAVVEVVADQVATVVRRAQASFHDVSMVATNVERIAERVIERSARVFRFVSELEQLRARHFDFRAEKTAQIKGEQTVVVAREVARMDGAQVVIG